MSSRIRSKAILKVVGLAVLAAMFCIGCNGDTDGGGGSYTYTITLDPAGGKVDPASVIVTGGGIRNEPTGKWGLISHLPTPTREGYTFHGWYKAEGGHGDAVSEHTAFAADDTIYAHWTLAHYRITFDAHGGEVTPAYDTTGYDWKLASLPTPSRDAYHDFVGWYTAPMDGTGEKVDDGHQYYANTTLYAHWLYTGVHYTITFDANEGTVDPATEETDAGGILQDFPIPERDGYFFIGWFTEKTGGTEVTTNTVFGAAATIYARWIFITDGMYTVTFETHGGTVTPKSGVTGEDGKLVSLPTPKRDGYTFQGWFTEDGVVTASTVFTAPTTIHATWAIVHYTITLDAAGGTVSPTTVKTGAHWELDTLPTPTRDGYTFRGWYTAETGGTHVMPQSTPLIGNLTIYAHWLLNDDHFTITFDANGGTVTPESAKTGDDFRLASLPEPTREGYVFHGWFTDKTGDTHVTKYTIFESDATVYARWDAAVYGAPVTYGSETYQTVVIGSQTWFARNLNYTVEGSKCYGQDGEVLVDSHDEKEHHYSYVTLSDAEVQSNCDRYGRLYDWEAAKGACPTGWHLPSKDEWATLADYVGGVSAAGWELRSASYWDTWEDWGNHIYGEDKFGFSALPGGGGTTYMSGVSPDGKKHELEYRDVGNSAAWWSSTKGGLTGQCGTFCDQIMAWRAHIMSNNEWLYIDGAGNSSVYFSVRCVKD